MRIINKLILSIFYFSLIYICCACSSVSESSFPCRKYAKQFFEQPSDKRVAEFGKLDIETQYCIFLYGNQVIHPPAIYLATEFAKQPSVLPFVTIKLKETKDDLTIRDIVYVISELERMKLYAVGRDKDLMALLNNKANEIKNDSWKKLTIETLNDLEKR